MFDRFNGTSMLAFHDYGSSGLGLWICKSLIELMGGNISLESTQGKGSQFTFMIQCALAPRLDAIASKTSPTNLNYQLDLDVLIVEDNDLNYKILDRHLTSVGCRCSRAGNGQIAVNMTNQNSYHVIFMDIEMPVMDGLTATKFIRQNETTNRKEPTPIIGLSGNARKEYVDLALGAGMNSFVVKPYQKEELYAILNIIQSNLKQ
eukprot:TRINITY_DN4417_c0_g1_i1.p1 TRINITY_DN4417_c0_g1~~TRINITY_DN4417_c0_g1_i1.p1  ORF type:complete len:228 (-),score=29.24 TRINITY_DN4417_c0_g1_i1:66-680(-)